MAAAEAVFKKAAPPAPIAVKAAAIPVGKETVTLKIDRDLLEAFQAEGPGWQDRINAALRAAIGYPVPADEGKRPEELNATNDD
jgi:uncharacterized protein (DUF4415 family)